MLITTSRQAVAFYCMIDAPLHFLRFTIRMHYECTLAARKERYIFDYLENLGVVLKLFRSISHLQQ